MVSKRVKASYYPYSIAATLFSYPSKSTCLCSLLFFPSCSSRGAGKYADDPGRIFERVKSPLRHPKAPKAPKAAKAPKVPKAVEVAKGRSVLADSRRRGARSACGGPGPERPNGRIRVPRHVAPFFFDFSSKRQVYAGLGGHTFGAGARRAEAGPRQGAALVHLGLEGRGSAGDAPWWVWGDKLAAKRRDLMRLPLGLLYRTVCVCVCVPAVNPSPIFSPWPRLIRESLSRRAAPPSFSALLPPSRFPPARGPAGSSEVLGGPAVFFPARGCGRA